MRVSLSPAGAGKSGRTASGARRSAPCRRGVAVALFAGLLSTGACSDPIDVCPRADDGVGRPAFDLVAALQGAGAEVQELGQRLDLTLFAAPTQVLSVDGEEVLMWEYCSPEQLSRDLGLYGIGPYGESPPGGALELDGHLFTEFEVLARYDADSAALLDLLTYVMGPELHP
jgi:hypothetical protein